MEELYVDTKIKKTEGSVDIADEAGAIWKKALILMSSAQYELAMNIITVANIFSVFFLPFKSLPTSPPLGAGLYSN